MTYDLQCTCGHVEDSHRRVVGGCRVKSCGCRRFLNKSYVEWLFNIADLQRHEAEEALEELVERTDVAMAAPAWKKTPPEQIFPELAADRGERLEEWRLRVVQEACDEAGVTPAMLKNKNRRGIVSVARARARAVRVLATKIDKVSAGRAVGLNDRSSVHHWISGKGKDKHR